MRDAVHALSSNQSRRALAAWQRPNVRELFDSLVPTREELGAWTELLKIEFLRLRCQHTDRFAETAARADAGLIQSRGEGLTEDTETLRAWYAEDKCFMLACHRGLCAFWRREVAGLRAQRRRRRREVYAVIALPFLSSERSRAFSSSARVPSKCCG